MGILMMNALLLSTIFKYHAPIISPAQQSVFQVVFIVVAFVSSYSWNRMYILSLWVFDATCMNKHRRQSRYRPALCICFVYNIYILHAQDVDVCNVHVGYHFFLIPILYPLLSSTLVGIDVSSVVVAVWSFWSFLRLFFDTARTLCVSLFVSLSFSPQPYCWRTETYIACDCEYTQCCYTVTTTDNINWVLLYLEFVEKIKRTEYSVCIWTSCCFSVDLQTVLYTLQYPML